MPIDPDATPESADADEEGRKPLPAPVRAQLKEAREKMGFSQAELGRRLGLSNVQIYRIESGKRGSRLSTVHKWLLECGISTEYVATSADEPERKALLMAAIGELDKAYLDHVLVVVQAWPRLNPSVRQAILTLVGAVEL